MYLQKLQLQGFKSFATKTTLEFAQGITAVVGPNGSGKSNVADAIKWVLGEQSLKSIRGKKSEDVIFAGSSEKSKMGMAEVSIFLNNDDNRMPIDFPEVVITRRLYRNGDSEYLINKNQARLMDIQDLLLRSGFGQKTYSVISQGQIGNILGATPQARKEMFDEAAGVKQYQVKRDSALRKLERTRQNLVRVTDLLQELKPRLRSLQKQSEKAQKGEVLTRELKTMQTKLFAHLWDKFTTKLREADDRYQQKNRAAAAIEKRIQEISALIEEEEKRTSTSVTQLQNLQKLADQAREELSRRQQELALTQGKISLEKEKATGVDVAGLTREQTEKAEQLKTVTKKLQSLLTQISGQEKELQTKLDAQKKFSEEIVELQSGIQKLQLAAHKTPRSGDLELELAATEKEMGNFATQLMTCNSLAELEKFKETASQLARKLKQLLDKYKVINGQAAPEQKDIQRLQTKLNELTSERENLSSQINSLRVAIASNQAQKAGWENQVAIFERDLETIVAKIKAGDKTASGRSRLHEELLQRERKLKADLTTAQDKFTAAKESVDKFNAQEHANKKSIFELERQYRDLQNQLNTKRQEQGQIQIEITKHQTRREDIDREMLNQLGDEAAAIKKLAEDHKHRALSKDQEQSLHQQIDKNKRQLDIIGRIDPAVIDEHEHLEKRVSFLDTQSSDLRNAAAKLKEVIGELDIKIKKQFDAAFQGINTEFTRYFKILFGGGEAKLTLLRQVHEIKDEDDENKVRKELVESIEIKAVPPGKKLKSINMLSGGEKTMTSLALLMAIISNNPSPFIVMDEVDAALDEANSRRYARILGKLCNKTQFIVVTHNRETMRQSKILYGVTMERNGVSKILSVKLEKAEAIAQ